MTPQLICQSRTASQAREGRRLVAVLHLQPMREPLPSGVAITDVIRAARKIMLEFQYEKAPASLRSAMGSLGSEGNPWVLKGANERSG